MKSKVHSSLNRIDFLDGIRAIAALFVLVSHVWYEIWPAAHPPLGYAHRPTDLTLQLTSWMYYGHFSVVIFVVLSGFCLMLPIVRGDGRLRGGIANFYRRRAKRILPPYYFALIISLFLISILIYSKTGKQWDISIPVTTTGVLSHLLMLQDIITPTEVNYVFWSVALEVHLYLFFPALIGGWRRFGALPTTLGVGMVIYAIIGTLELSNFDAIPAQFVGLCFYFVVGMAAASLEFSSSRMSEKVKQYFPWKTVIIFLTAAIVICCYLWGFDRAEENLAFLDGLCTLATVSLLIALSRPQNKSLNLFLGSKPLVSLGHFSYSLYLIHAPLLHVLWQYVIHPFRLGEDIEFILLLSGSPIIVCASYVFYRAFERPFLNTSIQT